MRKNRKAKRGIQHWYELLPWLFLLVALPITFVVWYGERTAEFNVIQNEFEYKLNETANQLTNQLALFEQSLHAFRSLFGASSFVSEDEFNGFVQDLLNSKFSSGIHQVGFAKLVNPIDPRTFNAIEAKFKPALMRLNQQSQSLSAPVLYVVPQVLSQENQLFNAFESKEVRKAMEFAALHNNALITENIVLVTSAQSSCDCRSMILPIYKSIKAESGLAIDGVKREVYGWVFLKLNLRTLFSGIMVGEDNPEVQYSLYQGLEKNAAQLLYPNGVSFQDIQNSAFSFHAQSRIEAHGVDWRLFAHSLPSFEKKINYEYSTKIGLVGLFISFSLTGILFLAIARIRALDSLKHINKRLKFSDDRWRFALEGSGDGIWDWDIQNKRMVFSKRWHQMLGYDEGELGETFEMWQKQIHPDDLSSVMKALTATLSNSEIYAIECRFKCKDGSWKWILARGMVVNRNEQSDPVRMVGTHTDISQLKRSEEMVWQHANLDSLTGLPNRRMLYARLEQELEKSKATGGKLALLFLDLDDFKEVNDTLGHDQGDVLLTLVAKRLSSCLQSQDVVARLGGDEFVILISGVVTNKLSHLDIVAQKVLASLEAPFQLSNEEVFISSSIGITVYPDDAVTIDELIKNVDQAMYASKDRGGNCFTYFTSKMQKEAASRLRLSNDLRGALSRNELYIEYQPIVALDTGQIYKAEALLRWQHPKRGLVSPVEFIPVAESTRLINEIGYWVYVESIKQCAAWRSQFDEDFQIAVNKSPIQFLNNEAQYSNWSQALKDHSLTGDAIVIEITEGLLLETSAQVGSVLKGYRDDGIKVALDDFGTGYSSLSYLRKFEIDYLKIDRSFVANLGVSSEDGILCDAIIAMAHSLGIKVVAEGIETAQQRDILLEAGCDFGQGYYFAKPMRPERFEAYMEQTVKDA